MTQQKFTLTEDHVKLLRRFCVGWCNDEYGAPEIDPKRPYGNSNVPADIHEILTGETIGCILSKREELTMTEFEKYHALHLTMETALQVVLSAGTFETGDYVAEPYSSRWQKV